MFTNLLKLYPEARLSDHLPELEDKKQYIFQNEARTEWITIPAAAISEKEVELLASLFTRVETPTETLAPALQQWKNYLFGRGSMPSGTEGASARIIQFQFYGENDDREELETALRGFFPEDVTVFWESHDRAVVVERGNFSLDEQDLASLSGALESDFFVKTAAYIGRQLPVADTLPDHFFMERGYFDFGKKFIEPAGFYTFEKVFPAYVASMLPDQLADALNSEFADAFRSDDEMYATVKGFLENGSNASLAAKKLFIHRNTLQYRIDKFTDKTGVSLKDFHSAFTVYLACLLYEKNRNQE